MQTEETLSSQFINPPSIIDRLEIDLGNVISDFGCGGGYFSIPLAQRVGKEGLVYALDVFPQALEVVESRAKTLGLTNIVTRRVNLEKKKGSGLEEKSIDWVVLKDVLFQNKDKDIVIEEAYRVLKPGGRALVVEWSKEDLIIGPEEKLRISMKTMTDLTRRHKFSFEENVGAGDFHYAMVIVK